MLKTFVLMTWVVFAATTASARIGWTLEQCREHYGHEIPGIPSCFEATDFFIVGKNRLGIHFAADGKADSIIYDRDKSEGEFTDMEIKALMERNCAELFWRHFGPNDWHHEEYWVGETPNGVQTPMFIATRVNVAGDYGFWIRTLQFDTEQRKALR